MNSETKYATSEPNAVSSECVEKVQLNGVTYAIRNKKFSPFWEEFLDSDLYSQWLREFTGAERMYRQVTREPKVFWHTLIEYDQLGDKYNYEAGYEQIVKKSPYPWFRAKLLFKENQIHGQQENGELFGRYRFIKTQNLVPELNEIRDFKNTYVNSVDEKRILKDQDIIITAFGTPGKNILFDAKKYPGIYAFQHTMLRWRFDEDKILQKFAFYYLRTWDFKAFVNSNVIGVTVPSISSKKFGNMLMPVPPLEVQKDVIYFLDGETKHIESLISTSENIIERLLELKGSLITSAVCGEISMDDLENLYDNHWVNSILSDPKYYAEIDSPKSSYIASWVNRIANRGGSFDDRFSNYNPAVDAVDAVEILEKHRVHSLYPWKQLKSLLESKIRYGNVSTGNLEGNTRILKIGDIDVNRQLRHDTTPFYFDGGDDDRKLIHGDIILARAGTVGKSFYFDKNKETGDFTFTEAWVRVRVDRSKMISKFLFYFTLTQNFWNFVSAMNTVTTQPNLSGSKYSRMYLPVPDLATQQRIIDFLDQKIPHIDNLISKLKSLVELQKEYRTSIITHAVTGAIDVNEFQEQHAASRALRQVRLSQTPEPEVVEAVAPEVMSDEEIAANLEKHRERRYGEIFPWWEIALEYFDK